MKTTISFLMIFYHLFDLKFSASASRHQHRHPHCKKNIFYLTNFFMKKQNIYIKYIWMFFFCTQLFSISMLLLQFSILQFTIVISQKQSSEYRRGIRNGTFTYEGVRNVCFFGKSYVGAKGMIPLRRFLYSSLPYLSEITQQKINDEVLFLVRLHPFMGFLTNFLNSYTVKKLLTPVSL